MTTGVLPKWRSYGFCPGCGSTAGHLSHCAFYGRRYDGITDSEAAQDDAERKRRWLQHQESVWRQSR